MRALYINQLGFFLPKSAEFNAFKQVAHYRSARSDVYKGSNGVDYRMVSSDGTVRQHNAADLKKNRMVMPLKIGTVRERAFAIEIDRLGIYDRESIEFKAYLQAQAQFLRTGSIVHSDVYRASNSNSYIMEIRDERTVVQVNTVDTKKWRYVSPLVSFEISPDGHSDSEHEVVDARRGRARRGQAADARRGQAADARRGRADGADADDRRGQADDRRGRPADGRRAQADDDHGVADDAAAGDTFRTKAYEMSFDEIVETVKTYSGRADRPKSDIFKYWQNNYKTNFRGGIRIIVAYPVKLPAIFRGSLLDRALPTVEITPTVFKWEKGQIYINFANRVLGGGVLGHGWVQEEFLTACLELFPFIGNLSRIYRELDVHPILIGTRAIFEPNLEYYGSKGLDANRAEIIADPSKVFHPIDPVQIYWLCMAAINLRGRAPTVGNIRQMLQVAIKSFHLATFTPEDAIIVNTGNWGAGAFGWDPRASFLIQYFAYLAVSTPYRLRYHAFDERIERLIKSIDMSFFAGVTVESAPDKILEYLLR